MENPITRLIERRYEVLNALLKNCKESDRAIAKRARISQPTVTRVRAKLEKAGILRGYNAIPNYAKLGYCFGSILTGKIFSEGSLKEIISKYDVILNAPCIALKNNILLITMHKTIENYFEFLKEIKTAVFPDATISLFDTKGLEVKPIQVSPRKGT